ncbi:MAG: transcription antitermination factor NusB [Paracoccaceae bacterium]
MVARQHTGNKTDAANPGKGDPRRGALLLLSAVLGQGRMLSELLAEPPAEFLALSPAGRARAQRLAVTVLRHVEPADRVLAPFLRKSPPLAIRNILRLATVEMLAEGEAPHGAVNAAVSLARADRKTVPLTGLVNAVLRQVAETGAAQWANLPPQRLPMWLRKPLVDLWGRETVSAIEAVQARPAPLDLTLAKPEAAEHWAERLGAERLPTGSLRLPTPGRIRELDGYATGDWWVQDAAAALPARLLAVRPGERVLDLCAAPGGKTLQLAAAGARVTALDLSERRLTRLSENLIRTGLHADIVCADALQWDGTGFDAVLLDAPCSATGTIRRHPDLPFVKDGSETAALVALQAALIDSARLRLKPGGRLVFCTCSLLPEEGEEQVRAALARHPDLTLARSDAAFLAPEWRARDGGLRLRPDHWAERGGIDGFYMAELRRAG